MKCRYKGERGPGASALAPPDPGRQQGTEGESQPPEPRTYEDGGREPNPRTVQPSPMGKLAAAKSSKPEEGLEGRTLVSRKA